MLTLQRIMPRTSKMTTKIPLSFTTAASLRIVVVNNMYLLKNKVHRLVSNSKSFPLWRHGLRLADSSVLRHLTSNTTVTAAAAAKNRNLVQGRHGSYAQEYAQSVQDPQAFWKKAADQLEWFQKPTRILEYEKDDSSPHHHFYRWFSDGIINLSFNCLDVHVKNGRANQDALIYDSPVTDVKERYTYSELLHQVATLAGGLQKELNVNIGDRVVIYMPMTPQAVIAMLACARIGAIHSVVFGGFAAHELAKRISDCQPKIIITASVGVEPTHLVPYKPLLEEALQLAKHNVERCIIVQRPMHTCELKYPMDLDYNDLMQNSQPVDAVPLPSTHVQHILYTSGTTGTPKGVVRDTGGWATALHYSMNAFYDTNPGEVQWTASDIGWIVGHAYIVYGPLLNGCTTVLYEGKPVGTPDAGAIWRVMSEYKVKTFFTAPTAFRAVKQADPHAEWVHQYDLSHLKTIFLAGEHSDPATLHYCERVLQKYGAPVNQAVDHWWQTELGQPAIGNAVGLGRMPIQYGACSAPVPGFQIDILDEHSGQPVTKPGQLGDLVLKLPLPPGTLTTLYNNNHERFVRDYLTKFPGYYDTSDAAFMDEDGHVHIVGRVDDIINTAGHRLSTGDMEEILMDHADVADCAVFPMKDHVKGEVPVGLVVVNKGSTITEEQLRKDLIHLVREKLGPVASFKKVGSVRALPKTRSGKILRGTCSKIANREDYVITPTVEDPTIFDYLEPEILKLVGKEQSP